MISIRCMVRSNGFYPQLYKSPYRTRRRPRLSCRFLGTSSGSTSATSNPSSSGRAGGEQDPGEDQNPHTSSSRPPAVDSSSDEISPPTPSSPSTSTRSSVSNASSTTSAATTGAATAAAVESAPPGELVNQDDTDAAAAAAAAAAALAAAATAQPPKVLFPWRHETADNLLPRLTPGTPESLYNTSELPLLGPNFIASVFLTIPWWKIMLGFDWRSDLAESSSYALTRGVAGIVSNVYHIPLSNVLVPKTITDIESDSIDDNQKVDFLYGIDESPSSAPESNSAESDVKSKVDTGSDSTSISDQKTNNDGKQTIKSSDYCPEVEYMLDRPLRQLFQAAHQHGRDQLQIRLQMTPTSRAMVYSVFGLPFVSKAAAERNPELLERWRKLMIKVKTAPSEFFGAFGSTYGFLLEQVERNDRLETTVELQVLVECDEIFQVIDLETGTILQGSPDGSARRVWHLVRFETTSTITSSENFPYLPNTHLGNWIITDIDDLLGPKKWYHK